VLCAIARGIAHDFLPAGLRAQDAIVIEPNLGHVTLPASQGTPPGQRVDGTIAIQDSGIAQVTITMAFDGGSGAELRGGIEGIAPAERASVLAERFVPSIVPGGSADPASIQITGLDEWEGPLTISFVAQTAGLVRPARDGYHVVPLFPSGIESGYARLETRTTTELVGEMDSQITLSIAGPGVLHAPEPADVAGPVGARTTLAVATANDGSITLTRHVHVPIALVPVATYPAFAAYCRATSQVDQRTVVLTPQ
jgi:hypothetical protein